jgi:hypothetical protein
MNRLKILLVLSAFVIAELLIIKYAQTAQVIPTTAPDFRAIQTTLRTYADIIDEASHTLDDSRLSEVLANDLRGGLVDPQYVKSVQYMTGKPDRKRIDIGFLDVNQARYAFDRRVRQLYDNAIARGELKIIPIPTDNAILPTPYDPLDKNITADMRATDQARRTYVWPPNPESVPEIRALEKATGLVAFISVPSTGEKIPTGFKILYISVFGDLAQAEVDWDYGLCNDSLIKKDGSWYLVGHKIIQWHGG